MRLILALMTVLIVPGCSVKSDIPGRQRDPGQAGIQLPSRPAGAVLDQADILPAAEEAGLNDQLVRLWQRNGDALVVVSVNSLGGDSIENYALKLANAWQIGDAKTERAILLLVAPSEHKVRIEVACGLQGIISDVTAGRIIRNTIVPRYRTGDFAGGTQAGVDALVVKLDLRKPVNDFGLPPPKCPSDVKAAA